MYRGDSKDYLGDLHFCLIFFEDRENVENFRFDMFCTITQEPQDMWEF